MEFAIRENSFDSSIFQQVFRQNEYELADLTDQIVLDIGAALAANGGQSDFVYGDYLELTANHQNKNRAFVLPDGTIMGWGKPTDGGDLKGLGAKGTNNYNELWAQKQVYGAFQ